MYFSLLKTASSAGRETRVAVYCISGSKEQNARSQERRAFNDHGKLQLQPRKRLTDFCRSSTQGGSPRKPSF
jgi:hypothetical protein